MVNSLEFEGNDSSILSQPTRKMKLLLVTYDTFPPFRVDISVLFGKKLKQGGHHIDLLCQSETACAASYETTWAGGRAFIGRTHTGDCFLNRGLKNICRIIHELKLIFFALRNRYDIILVKDLFFSALVALLAAKLLGFKFVYWLSFPFPEASLYQVQQGTSRYPFISILTGHITRFLLYTFILRFSSHSLVQSDQMKKEFVARGISADTMTSVPMGVEVNEIPYFGYTFDTLDTTAHRTIVYLGALSRARRLDFLLRSFHLLLKEKPNVTLYLVGGGYETGDEEAILQYADKLGIRDKVVVTGFLPQKAALEYARDAALCVSPIDPSPMHWPSSPTKLIEYMAMGKAVVANDLPEQKAVLDYSQAGLCVPYEEQAFSIAMAFLLNNLREAELMGIRGRRFVQERRSYDRISYMLEQVLLNLVQKDEDIGNSL